MFRVELDGFEDLSRALNELPREVGPGVLRRALKKAGQPVADMANSLAPSDSGDLGRSYIVTGRLIATQRAEAGRRTRGDVPMYVGANYARGTPNYAPHAHLVEFGTGPRFHASGKAVGHMPAQPHFRPAWEQYRTKIVAMIGQELEPIIERAAKRHAPPKSRR